MKHKLLKNQKGQTAVEYVMVIAVSVSIAVAVFKKLNTYFLDSPNSYFGSKVQIFNDIYNPQGGYKRYHVPR